MTKAFWLAGGVVVYFLAAWSTAPGFYDGYVPPEPYRFVSPPPGVTNGNGPPQGAHHQARVVNGTVDPGASFTADGQAELSWIPGAFAPTSNGGDVIIDIKPVADFPTPTGLKFLTNVYRITASTKLAQPALVTLRYSSDLPSPSFVYAAPQGSTSWQSIGSTNTAAPFTISARTQSLGYFAAGYPANTTPPPGSPRLGGGQSVPILVALVILIVIVATLPLAFTRRRRGGG